MDTTRLFIIEIDKIMSELCIICADITFIHHKGWLGSSHSALIKGDLVVLINIVGSDVFFSAHDIGTYGERAGATAVDGQVALVGVGLDGCEFDTYICKSNCCSSFERKLD